MTTSTNNIYAVYLTAATSTMAVGTVVNRIVWDGKTGWTSPAGQSAVEDNTGEYPIGSIYTASTT